MFMFLVKLRVSGHISQSEYDNTTFKLILFKGNDASGIFNMC